MHAIDGRQQGSQRSAKGEGEFHAPNGAQSVGIDGWQGIHDTTGWFGGANYGFEKGRKFRNHGSIGSLTFNSISGWWLTHPSEKYEFVSWDDDIPNIWKKYFQTTNQIWCRIHPIPSGLKVALRMTFVGLLPPHEAA